MKFRTNALIAILSIFQVKAVTAKYAKSFQNISITYEPTNTDSPKFLLITTAVPTDDMARKYAREMVTKGIAALVNVLPPEVSVFKWDGQVQEVTEIVLFIYTQESQFDNVEQYIRANSLDEEPGILAIPIVKGSSTFLKWMASQTQT